MITRSEKTNLIKEFGANEQDTGSTAVQIAIVSKRIEALQAHMQINKKDFSTQRGLMKLVHQRKDLLVYLQRIDMQSYKDVIKRLGIRK